MIASAWGGRLANFKGLLLQFGPEAKCYWDGRLRAVSDCQTMHLSTLFGVDAYALTVEGGRDWRLMVCVQCSGKGAGARTHRVVPTAAGSAPRHC